MHRRTLLAAATAVAALAAPAAAQAHVTLQPDAAPAGAFTRLDVRVPTERSVATRRVVVELPAGFAYASYQPVAGWDVRLRTRALAHPLKLGDDTVDQEVSRITWTARSAKDAIPPGAFQDFGLAVRVPDGKVGSKLTFKALQVYADGKVVRWIGAPDAADPAPQVTLSDTPDPAAAVAAKAQARAQGTPHAAAHARTDLPSRNLVLAALAAGGVGLLAGLGALRSRA
jgi:periplasmic copper chaperone A